MTIEIKALPRKEKLLLVQELWDDIINTPEEIGLTDEQKAGLDEALKEIESDPKAGANWTEVKQRILGRL